ncbi:MAG: hypothetical protein HYS13_21580 [Planctomycetia bacterium]|nr:hypothetical protein [Planctomycetia bacterium]
MAASLCVFSIAGCGQDAAQPAGGNQAASGTPSTTHDPNDVPLTKDEIKQIKAENAKFTDAVTNIQSFRDTIRDAIAAGTPAKAHRSLDKLDVVLQALPDIAQSSNIPKEQWQTVGENAQKLRDLFNQVHANIDAGKEPDYTSVSGDVDKAVDALKGVSATSKTE